MCVRACVCVLQLSELALQVAILFYGGHLVVSGQMTGGTLIAFIIYALELVECLEVRPDRRVTVSVHCVL